MTKASILLDLLNALPSCAGVIYDHKREAEQLVEVCYDSPVTGCPPGKLSSLFYGPFFG